jgi:hypothetical protein
LSAGELREQFLHGDFRIDGGGLNQALN